MEEIKEVHLLTAPSGVFDERNFWVYYESVSRFHDNSHKIFLGEKYMCRFCSESRPIQFTKEAHTCPEFTGNTYLFSNDECNNCNSIFSKYETHLANHSHFMRTLFGIKGKKSTISLVSNNQSLVFKRTKKGLTAYVNKDKAKGASRNSEGLTEKYDFGKNTRSFDFKFKKKQHVPLYLFKSLCKIAFSLMPKNELESDRFENFTRWIRIPDDGFAHAPDYEPYFYIYHNQLKTHKHAPLLMLFKKRPEHALANFPSFSFLLLFGNLAYQIFLPFIKDDDANLHAQKLFLPIIPELITENENGKLGLIWMNGMSLKKTELEDYHFVLNSNAI